MLEVAPFEPAHLPALGDMLSARLRRLRRRVPALPVRLTAPDAAIDHLARALDPARTLVAVERGAVVGYLAWTEYPTFRWTPRRGAHSPEWGNAALPGRSVEAWRALYPAAATRWFEAGCHVHAITTLAGDPALERALVESGFGMLLHDALRPLDRIDAPPAGGLRVRRATLLDLPALAELEREHRRHYGAPPVLMVAPAPDTEGDLRRVLETESGSIWLATADGRPQGFLRFELASDGAVIVSLAPTTISITGAFVRPAWRGKGAARAMLARAIVHYHDLGFERVAVDYETINPDALAFWPKAFSVVAVSMLRVPERAPDAVGGRSSRPPAILSPA